MSKQTGTSENYDFYMRMDTTPYIGQWLAISGGKLITHGKRADRVYYKAKKIVGDKIIALSKVSNPGVMSFSI
jgi:hypothetical protein